MMKFALPALGALALAYSANAAVSFSSTVNSVIPDGNPNGYATSIDVGTLGGGLVISEVSVQFSISGGYNGDLYSYLTYTPSGSQTAQGFAVLLNRVGRDSGNQFGFSTSGLNVLLGDSGADIHTVQTPEAPNTMYRIDGRNVSPSAVVTADYDNPANRTSMASFNGAAANGTWTLYFADLSAGEVSTLDSWSVNITAVPEPVNVALGILGGIGCVGLLVRHRRRRMG